MMKYGIFAEKDGTFSFRKALAGIIVLAILYVPIARSIWMPGESASGFNYPAELWAVIYMVVTYYFLKNAKLDKLNAFVKK